MKSPRRFLKQNTPKNNDLFAEFKKKYELTSHQLGKGAYAEVLLAKCVETGESVAVKRITKAGLKHRDMQKIHKEVGILKALRHRNVVKVYESYEDEDFFYMVMEYVKGGELFQRIVSDDGRFDEGTCKEMIRTLLMAMKYCKDNGVIHRDLKPENLLLTEDNDLKVVDFNLAKKVDKDTVNFSILETMCGTPSYVAPEVISGTPYDYKCDVWSLGVISYLLISGGYLPFFVNPKAESDPKQALLAKVRAGNWKFTPQKAWLDVSPMAKDFVSKMLVTDPEARYGYEQLLGHQWMKTEAGLLTRRIETKKLLQFSQMKKMLEVNAITAAVSRFKDLLGEDNNDPLSSSTKGAITPYNPTSGERAFDSLEDSF